MTDWNVKRMQEFCEEEFAIVKTNTELNWNRFGISVCWNIANFAPKPNRIWFWKTLWNSEDNFSEPNWNRFGNGHWIKCSCTAIRTDQAKNEEADLILADSKRSWKAISCQNYKNWQLGVGLRKLLRKNKWNEICIDIGHIKIRSIFWSVLN